MAPRSKYIQTAALTAALLAACGAAYALQPLRYTIAAGPITGSYDAGINGSFRVDTATGGGGIESQRGGGACIIFRAKDLGFTKMAKVNCKKEADCVTEESPGVTRSGYCQLPTGKCWAKPVLPTAREADAAVCRRNIEYTPVIFWDPGVDNPVSEQPIPIAGLGVHRNAKARVLACLNGIPGGGCGGAPGAGQPIHDWGKSKQLH